MGLNCIFVTILSSPVIRNQTPVKVSERVPNPCLTLSGTKCVFPFKYEGVEYYRCTYAASPVPWCATMVDSNGTVVTNNWGDCSNTALSSCPAESLNIPSCTTDGGPKDNTACVFPFRHLGVTYNSCATTSDKEKAWCSTNTTEAGEHIEGHYGFCPQTCPGAEENTSTSTTTTFSSTTSTTPPATTATTTTAVTTSTTTLQTTTTGTSTTTSPTTTASTVTPSSTTTTSSTSDP